jgi:hypothetical protein
MRQAQSRKIEVNRANLPETQEVSGSVIWIIVVWQARFVGTDTYESSKKRKRDCGKNLAD